jgi:hypothetical protein
VNAEEKLQAPSTNIRRSSKIQTPKIAPGIWSLALGISLEFGTWGFGAFMVGADQDATAHR